MKQYQLITASLVTIFAYNNIGAQTPVSPDLIAAKKNIENTNAVYFHLFAKKDMAIVDLYTDDAALLAPNTLPISGIKALKKDFEDTFTAGKVKAVRFRTSAIYGNGKDYVTEDGTWQVFDLKGKIMDDGKYLKVWKKTKRGWKIFRDLFNSNHKGQ